MPLSRVASALAVLAVVAVLGTAVTTVAAYTRRHGDGGSGGEAAGHAFESGQVVVRGDAVFEVPARAEGWTTQGRGTLIYYVDRRGDPAVGVSGPAVFRDGYCRREPAGSNRGFVGLTRSATGMSARAANTALSHDWVEAVALDEDLRTSSPHTSLRTRAVTLADGSPAVRSDARITRTDRGPCDAPTVHFTLVSLATGDGVASLVLVRDAGAPGTLPDDVAERILGTLRRAVAG